MVRRTALFATAFALSLILLAPDWASADDNTVVAAGFSDQLPVSGVALMVWDGGSVTSVRTGYPNVGSVWVADGGELIGYVFGSPDFVNVTFLELYPGGNVPPGTAMIVAVVSGAAESAPPTTPDPPRADATACPAPRTAATALGLALRVEAGLCELVLSTGDNVLRWERTATTPDLAFGGMDFGLEQDALSVWYRDIEDNVWRGWGPAVPPGVVPLVTVEPGGIYVVDAPSAITWELPRAPSIFEGAQVVSFYGFPGIPSMGALGRYTPAGAIEAVGELAAQYDALNGELNVVPAIHPIVAVATPDPLSDGSYLNRMAHPTVASYGDIVKSCG